MPRSWNLLARLLPARYRDAVRGFTTNARRYLATVALQNAGYGVIGTVFAIELKNRGFAESVVGDVEGALALAAAVVCLTLPPLVSSLGYRRLMIAAGLALGLARLGQAYAPSAVLVVALGLLYGLGDGAMQALSTAFLSENAGRSGRTQLFTADFVLRTASMVVGSLVGGIAPVLLRPMVGEADAYRLTIVLAAVMMAGSTVFAAGIEERHHGQGRLFAGWLASLKGFTSWGRVVRLLVPEMFISFGAGLVIPFVALFLKHRLGATVTEVGVIQAVSSVAMAAAAGVTMWLFFPILLAAVFGFAREIGVERRWALIAVLMAATVPTAYHISASAYIDIALVLFVTLAIDALTRWWRTLESGWLLLVAIFLAAALSAKLITLFVFAAIAVVIIMRARSGGSPGVNAAKTIGSGLLGISAADTSSPNNARISSASTSAGSEENTMILEGEA